MKRIRGILVYGLAVGIVLSMAIVAAPRARAYGSTALWQIAISGNFNSASGGGGIWVWAEFDSGSGGNATVTDCGHSQFLPSAPFGGAGHVNIMITGWKIAPGTAGPMTFFVTSEVDTIVGSSGIITVTVPSENFDTGVPAVAGHYNTLEILGFSAPGVSFQIQVAQLTS